MVQWIWFYYHIETKHQIWAKQSWNPINVLNISCQTTAFGICNLNSPTFSSAINWEKKTNLHLWNSIKIIFCLFGNGKQHNECNLRDGRVISWNEKNIINIKRKWKWKEIRSIWRKALSDFIYLILVSVNNETSQKDARIIHFSNWIQKPNWRNSAADVYVIQIQNFVHIFFLLLTLCFSYH